MMKKEVAISLILPIYNVAPFLEQCLDCIVSQTFQNFEVIMVNDGSTDGSDLIAQRYAKEYDNFFLVNQENGGLSAARNTGIEQASGTYICFVDSDDYISKDYLLRLYEAAKEHCADMVIADYHEVDAEGRDLQKDKGDCPYRNGIVEQDVLLDALTSVGENHYATAVVVAWNKLIKTDIMKTLRYPEGVLHEDEFLCMPLLLACKRSVWIPDDVYAYRQRENSIMQDEKLAFRHLRVLDAFEERIALCATLDKPKLYRKLAMAYFWDLEVWYYFMRTKYKIPWYRVYFFFTKRMRKHLRKYYRILRKRKIMEYAIFTVSPEFFLRQYYN